jgi:hypothetical protein
MKTHTKALIPALLTFAFAAGDASAAIVTASADGIGRFKASAADTTPSSVYAGNLGIGPVSGSDDYFRTFLTFDVSGESLAGGATTLTLSGTGFGSSDESNDLELLQTFTLYSLASDWDGATAPGPGPGSGTILDTTDLTITTGDDTQDLIFSSAALTTAFNDAFSGSGLLYLGIVSSGESLTPAANDRSFKERDAMK